MKKIIKGLLGEKLINYIRPIKIKYFPSEFQKKIIEKENKALLRRKKLFSDYIQEGDLCFDVGANIGNRVGPLLDIGARVVAVEPQKSCYDILASKFGNKIILVTKGLSNTEEVKKFYIADDPTISSFSEEWIGAVKADRFKDSNWNKVVEIEMTTLDKLIAQYGVPVFIKIDVEGYEVEVLKGLHSPIKLISFEYTVPEQTAKVIDCIIHIQNANNNIECNYSVEESMELALESWLTVDQMKEYVLSKQFIDTGFGDVYVRTKR
jgi:FkbM family methyltransferase